jgi:uncharacterized protein (DUF697 family)
MHGSMCPCPKCRATRETAFESESFEFGGSGGGEVGSLLTEAEEVELAMELMAVTNEAEMEQFLGNVFKKAWSGIKKIAKPLGGVLKSVAKKALPFVGSALGSFIPIPGVGTALGGALGTAVSKALELEYGELESEEAEFEMARRFVRIAASAAQQAGAAPQTGDLMSAANRAVVDAARQHLPGADLRALGASTDRLSGRWFRQGANIVVVGG